MKLFYRFWHSVAHLVGRVFYRERVYGLENLPEGPALIAPNHASHLDPPLVASFLPVEVHFLARETLFDIPIIGWMIRKLNTHPVGGVGASFESIRTVGRLLQEGKKVMIFPEGTRTLTGELGECAPGVGMLAMRADVPVVPIYIHGTYEVWSRHRRFPKLRGKLTMLVGKPIHPADYQEGNRKEAQRRLAEDVMVEIARLKADHLKEISVKK